MSQFIMIGRAPESSMPGGLQAKVASSNDALLAAVATTYFSGPSEVRLVTDEQGGAESLVDDIWEALAAGKSPLATSIGKFLEGLISSGIGFVLWCGDDFTELNVVHSVGELLMQFKKQAAAQPAEVWLVYQPA